MIILGLALICTSCVCTRVARPPDPVEIATEWLGFCGCETFYLRLTTNGTGTCVYMLPNETAGAVSTVTHWELEGRKISIACTGVTYPDETIKIMGLTSGSYIDVNIRGKNTACPWNREGRILRVDDILREIQVGRAGAGKQ